MKKKLLISIGLLFLQIVRAQVSGIEWKASYGNLNNISMVIHGTASSGNGYLFTSIYDEYLPNSIQYGILTKTNGGGTQVWNKEFQQTGLQRGTLVHDVRYVSDNYILTGQMVPVGNNDSFAKQGIMIKMDQNGNTLWAKNYGVPSGWDNISFTKVIPTSDNGFLLGGVVANSTDYDFFVLKTDANGNEQWRKRYGGTNRDYLDDMAVNAEGNFYLVGRTESMDGDVSNGNGFSTWAVKVSPTGTLLWEHAFQGASHDYPYVRVTDTADNGCALIYMETQDISGVEITKFSTTGAMQWKNDYTPYPDFWNNLNILKSQNGQIVFGSGGIFLKALTLNGTVLWSWQNPDTTYSLRNTELIQTPDQGYLFTGANVNENKIEALKLLPAAVLSTQNEEKISENEMYPNPSDGNFTIHSKNSKIYSITITDSSGKIVYKHNAIKNEYHLNLKTHLAEGIYFVDILSEGGQKESKKLLIRK